MSDLTRLAAKARLPDWQGDVDLVAQALRREGLTSAHAAAAAGAVVDVLRANGRLLITPERLREAIVAGDITINDRRRLLP